MQHILCKVHAEAEVTGEHQAYNTTQQNPIVQRIWW